MTDNQEQNTTPPEAPICDEIVEGDLNVVVDVARKKKKPNSKEYNLAYYHRTKKEVQCQYCGNKYGITSAMVRHQRRSSKCAVQQIGGMWNTVRSFIIEPDPQLEDIMKKMDDFIVK